MSRLEETERVINCTDWCNGWEGEARSMHHIARTLAAEVDELRGKLDDVRMGIGCARGQRSTQFCADITGVRAELDAATDMAIHYRDSAMAGDAELARVKAESLRVVPVGEPCEYGMWLEQQSSTAFLLDDEVDVHVTINRYQSANGGPSAPIEGDTIVQPVRLERWEDE